MTTQPLEYSHLCNTSLAFHHPIFNPKQHCRSYSCDKIFLQAYAVLFDCKLYSKQSSIHPAWILCSAPSLSPLLCKIDPSPRYLKCETFGIISHPIFILSLNLWTYVKLEPYILRTSHFHLQRLGTKSKVNNGANFLFLGIMQSKERRRGITHYLHQKWDHSFQTSLHQQEISN